MNFKKLAVASAVALAASGSYAAAPGEVVFSQDFGASFSGSTVDAVTTFDFGGVEIPVGLLSWELGVVGTGKITISKVTFNDVMGTKVSDKLWTGEGSFGGGPLMVVVTSSTSPKGSYGGSLSVSAIPEPETYALMLAGLGAVAFMARRRKA